MIVESPCEEIEGEFFMSKNVATRKSVKANRRLSQGQISIVATFLLVVAVNAGAFTTEASYYTYASCIREGTSGIMANRKVLNDKALSCASWDYPFGTRLKVTRLDRKDLQVIVKVTDRGPSKRLYKGGRRLDLSLAAAKSLGMVKQGLARVEVMEVN